MRPTPRSRRWSPGERTDAERFHRLTVALGCRVCDRLGLDCDGTVHAHHVIRQQHLRSWVSLKARAEQFTAGEEEDLRVSVLWDVRNGLAVCERAHRRHHNRVEPIPRSVLLPANILFANDLQLTHRIEAEYPALDFAS